MWNLSGNSPHNMSCTEVTSFTACPLHPDIKLALLAEGFIRHQLWDAKPIHRTRSSNHFITSPPVRCCFSITHWLLFFGFAFTSLFFQSLGKLQERMDTLKLRIHLTTWKLLSAPLLSVIYLKGTLNGHLKFHREVAHIGVISPEITLFPSYWKTILTTD